MSIRRIQEFSPLIPQAGASLDAKLELLKSHWQEVQQPIRDMEDKLKIIEAKIKRFRQLREGPGSISDALNN
jgi:hypothetical protein